MQKHKLLFIVLTLVSIDMAKCQTKDYKEKLESLYSHTVPMISSQKLSEEMESNSPIILLDIRSEEEYHVSHLKDAKLIDYDHFKKKDVKEISLNSQIIVYCSVGYRSEKIGEKLLKMGYTDVENLYGGIFQWKNEGYSIVNDKSQDTDSVHTYNKNWSRWLTNGVKVY